jgi:DnaJ-class molecular chaperone
LNQRRDYYRLLHVDPDAPEEVIKASYRTLMQRLRMHPDLGGDHAGAILLNEAFRVLGHRDRRADYDSWLELTREAAPGTVSAAESAAATSSTSPCGFCKTVHSLACLPDPERVCARCGASLYPVQHHQTNEDTRRAIGRLPRLMRVTFMAAEREQPIGRGMTQDISLAGMRLLTHSSVPADARLLIECEFCSAVGDVRSVRRHPVDASGWEVGVQFVTMRLKRQRGSLISTVA